MTVSEAALWSGIRRRQTGARFRRQVPIGVWIADFASFDPRLVEVDDPSHEHRDESSRTRYFQSLGFTVIRFTNEWIAKERPSAIQTIRNYVADLKPEGPPVSSPEGGGKPEGPEGEETERGQRAVAARVAFRSARALVTET